MSGFWFTWSGDGPRNRHFLKIPLLILTPSLDWELWLWSNASFFRWGNGGWEKRLVFPRGHSEREAEQILPCARRWPLVWDPWVLDVAKLESWSPGRSPNLCHVGHFPYSWLSSWAWPGPSRWPLCCSLHPLLLPFSVRTPHFSCWVSTALWFVLPHAICVALYDLHALPIPS